MSMSASNHFLTLKAATALALPADDHFSAAGHWWSQCEIDALILAHAARRPLLVRGEAGSGKSQIARAAAQVLDSGSPLVEVIHPRFEALDLLWRLDAVERLADAQLERLDESNQKYVKHGKLWQAIEQAQSATAPTPVLLIDEIDKADADVPNALLDVLGNRCFNVPPLGNFTVHGGDRLPLIVITTNEERELPAAFVRRCIVLNVNPPTEDQDFVNWLVERGKVHTRLDITDDARDHAARQVLDDRKVAISSGYPRVGLAEYIDLLTALHELTLTESSDTRAKAQTNWLDRLSAYALVKNADQPQNRKPVERTEASSGSGASAG